MKTTLINHQETLSSFGFSQPLAPGAVSTFYLTLHMGIHSFSWYWKLLNFRSTPNTGAGVWIETTSQTSSSQKISIWHFSWIWFGSSSIPPEKESTGTCGTNRSVGGWSWGDRCKDHTDRPQVGPVTMRKCELPATESIQEEAGRPLAAYRGLDEIIQKGLLVFKRHDSETLGSRLTNPPNVRWEPCMASLVGGCVSTCVCTRVCMCTGSLLPLSLALPHQQGQINPLVAGTGTPCLSLLTSLLAKTPTG